MKTLSIAGILGAGIFLPGCETTVVDRRRGSEGYYDNGRTGYGTTGYRTGSVRQTNVYENNVYETNAHRNTVNRTVKETDATGRRSTVHGQASPGTQAQGVPKAQSSTKVKAAGNHKKTDTKKKPNNDSQANQ